MYQPCKYLGFSLLALSLLSGCGGSSGSSDPEAPNAQEEEPQPTDSNGSTPEEPNPSQGEFDLSEYLFPRDARVANGDVSFTEEMYSQDSGELAFSIPRRFTHTDGSTINEYSFYDVIKTFFIDQTEIVETLLDLDGATRTSARFADVGDTYMNADYSPPESDPIGMDQNASCRVLEHLDTFDVSTADGDYTLASGVYSDVLKNRMHHQLCV